MPGALVHANLIASLLHFGTEQKDEEGAKLLVEVSTVFVSATMITGLYWSAVEWLREKQRQPNRGKIWEFVASAFELIWFPVVVIFTALVVAAIDVLVGAKVLLRGVNIGSFVPVFGVILEGLVHIGHIIYGWLHRVASLIIDLTLRVVRKNAAAPVIFACVFCYSILGVVRAEEPIGSVGYLQVEGDKASVVVQRPGEIAPRSGDQVFEVFANDTIWVTNAGT
jgi:hypothetical protein